MFHDVLTSEELYALSLRKLFHSYGYHHKIMSRFESYDFYAGKKDFLISQNIFTFTDTDGKLMTLRPDITLSLVAKSEAGKYYYDETVYRADDNSGKCTEIKQVGIECIGGLRGDDIIQVAQLALMSLHEVSRGKGYILDVADAGIVAHLLTGNNSAVMLKCLQDKNFHGLKALNVPQRLLHLAMIDGDIASGMEYLGQDCRHVVTALDDPHVRIDFSAVSNLTYYNGIVLKGYIEEVPKAVLSGGQYNIAGKFGAGFAVYLDRIGGGIGD